MEAFGEFPGFLYGFPILRKEVDRKSALSEPEGGLEVFKKTGTVFFREDEPVLEDFEDGLRFPMEAGEALGGEDLLHRSDADTFLQGDFEGDIGGPAGSGGKKIRGYGLGRVPPNGFPAGPAEEPGSPGEEELEVVIQLRHGPDGRPRGPDRIRLVDRDGRGNSFYPVGLRLVHALEELARVGGKGLDVPPLPLGVDRVEGEG